MMDPGPAQPVGSRVVGRYVISGEIAHGGMATVHFGRLVGEVGFSRTVAVKSLHPQYAKDPEFKSMFLDEARLCARVRHPNVVPIVDVVALEGELFMVMEYVQGETLSRLIRVMRGSSKRIPLRVVSAIMTNALEGLHAAHEAVSEQGEPLGIVHRDVSPQNIMVGVDGVARVLDFGVAKAAGRLQSTRDGQLKGKLPYMAPEQLRGTRIDRRTDVYASAAVLWEALTGRRLFDAEDEVVIFGKVLESAVEPPSTIVPSLPRSLDDVCLKGLARDPDRRFQTAQDMAIALERAVGVAIPREVGRWVEQNAASSLRKRAEKISELESVSSVNIQNLMAVSSQRAAELTPPPAPPYAVAPVIVSEPASTGYVPPGVQTDPNLQIQQELYSKPSQVSMVTQAQLALAMSQQARHASRSPVVVVAAIIAAVIVFLAAAAALVFMRTAPGANAAGSGPATTTAPPPASTPVAATTPSAPATAPSAPVASVADPPATTRPPVTGGANTAKRPPPPATTAAPPEKTAAPPPPAKPDCNPPYTLDANGVRIPKAQCL
jgi:eukaryotic-like serine/threonine-protein kinase